MTAGLHAVNFANKLLNTLSNTSFAAGATTYVAMHTGDPGSAGTSNAGQDTTRKALTWAAASAGSKAIAATLPTWTIATITGTDTITYMSVWDASTSGNFLYSFSVTSKPVTTGDILNLTAHTISFTPIAA